MIYHTKSTGTVCAPGALFLGESEFVVDDFRERLDRHGAAHELAVDEEGRGGANTGLLAVFHVLCHDIDTSGSFCEMTLVRADEKGQPVQSEVMIPSGMVRLVISVSSAATDFGFG